MKVVVVLPGYNCEKTISKVVDLIPKSCVDEIVYVDDCSSDKSFDIAKSLNLNYTIRHNKILDMVEIRKPCIINHWK